MSPSREVVHVLVVEDDNDDYFITRRLLSKAEHVRFKVERASDYDEALVAVTSGRFHVCLVDYRLGAHDGVELMHAAHAEGYDIPMILLTGQGDSEVDLSAMMAGAADYLIKGQIDARLLERSIRYASERHRAEERIREQAALLDKAQDAIVAYDLDGHVIYWNKSAERLTGWTAAEMQEAPPPETDPTQLKSWAYVLKHNEWVGECKQATKSGTQLIVESHWTLVRDRGGNPKSILVINTDLTERKKLETQFLRAQRMESIGTLVGGIAHDLGNLLVPVLLGVKVLRHRVDSTNERVERTLNMIERSAQRGSEMVKQVLSFARGVEGERKSLNPAAVIHEVEKIVRDTFGKKITLTVDVADDLWTVLADSTQVQQVLMNLCVNARDAMDKVGSLQIKAHNIEVDESYARLSLAAKPGTYVVIGVEDNGPGIPPEVLAKIFEPFFTTKPVGKGTGLGLSTVYSIVKSHGGFVNVYSEVGQGTVFHVYLPATQASEVQSLQATSSELLKGNGEQILVVDDEAWIRHAVQDILEQAAYQVTTVSDGREAVALFEQDPTAFDLVLTDIMMPYMDGVATTKALKAIRPQLPIIAASGIATDRAEDVLAAGALVCLSKPYTAERLCAVIREGLARYST